MEAYRKRGITSAELLEAERALYARRGWNYDSRKNDAGPLSRYWAAQCNWYLYHVAPYLHFRFQDKAIMARVIHQTPSDTARLPK